MANVNTSNMSDRDLALANWAGRRLSNTMPDSPRTKAALMKVLSPSSGKVVCNCNLEKTLDNIGRLSGNRSGALTVPVYTENTETVHLVTDITRLLWKACQRKARALHMTPIHVAGTDGSIMEHEVKQAIANWLGNRTMAGNDSVTATEFKQELISLYLKTATRAQEKYDATGNIIKCLTDLEYISVDELTGAVTYKIPSAFTVLCLKQIVEKTQQWWDAAFSTTARDKGTGQARDLKPFPNYFDNLVAAHVQTIRELAFVFHKTDDNIVKKEQFLRAVCLLNNDSHQNEENVYVRFGREKKTKTVSYDAVTLERNEVYKASAKVASNILEDLCKDVQQMNIEDIDFVDPDLTFESAVTILNLLKMDESKPKKLSTLERVIGKTSKFFPFIPLSNVYSSTGLATKKKISTHSQTIHLKKSFSLVDISLDPNSEDFFVEQVKVTKKKMCAKEKVANTKRPGMKRKWCEVEKSKCPSPKQKSDACKKLVERTTSNATYLAQKLSTMVLPPNFDSHLRAIQNVRLVIDKFQKQVLANESDMNKFNKAKLHQDLVSASVVIELFSVTEAIGLLVQAGIINHQPLLRITVSKDIENMVRKIQEEEDKIKSNNTDDKIMRNVSISNSKLEKCDSYIKLYGRRHKYLKH